MSTTIHLPPELLAAVDRQAQGLAMTRNRYIIRALTRALETETRWSTRFARELEPTESDAEDREALAEMRRALAANRTRKPPLAL